MRWDYQRMYLEMLDEDEEIPFSLDAPTGGDAAAQSGPMIRKDVDTGADVLDINAMRKQLEADRSARKGGG